MNEWRVSSWEHWFRSKPSLSFFLSPGLAVRLSGVRRSRRERRAEEDGRHPEQPGPPGPSRLRRGRRLLIGPLLQQKAELTFDLSQGPNGAVSD